MQKLLSFDECSKVESQTQLLHAAGDLRNFRQALSLKNDTQRVVAKKINGWVEKETKNNIKDLVSPKMLKKGTNLIMVNAIHFKASWEKPFDRSNRETFYSENMKKRSVSMMELD